ncbi:MAG: hypothetical protein ACRDKW_17895 [Actinomycetota bacterium]
MKDTDVATKTQPSMEELMAEQRRRFEEARARMREAGKDPRNREPLEHGKGHGGGACLHF